MNVSIVYSLFFFFFKQKTAYEMRISDWSSDVCSSDLDIARRAVVAGARQPDEGLGDILLGDPHRVIIAALRGTFGADRHIAARQAGFIEMAGHDDSLFPQRIALRNPVARLGDNFGQDFFPTRQPRPVRDQTFAHLHREPTT